MKNGNYCNAVQCEICIKKVAKAQNSLLLLFALLSIMCMGPFFWLLHHLNFITMPDHKYLSRNRTIWGIIPIHIMLKM